MMADEEWCISKYIPIKKHYEVAYYSTNFISGLEKWIGRRLLTENHDLHDI